MKRFFLVPLSILLIGIVIFGGCAKTAPAPAPGPAPPPAPEKPIELKLSHYLPPPVWLHGQIYIPWTKEIEERSNGRVKITIFPAESLGKVQDHYNMLLSGQADIVQVDIGSMQGVFPLTEGLALPLLFKTTEAAGATWWELSEKYLMDTEYKNAKVLWHQAIAPSQLNTAKKPIHNIEDFSGMKISATQEAGIKALEKLGATPVFFPIPEIYTALERGIVDGAIEPWEAVMVFKFFEITKYRTAIGLFTALTTVWMNLDVWNSLPPDIQQMITDTTGFEASRVFGEKFDGVERHFLEDVIKPYDREKGNPEVYYLPEAERERWHEAVTPLYEEWIVEREAKGLPARAFFEDLLRIASKYDK